MQRHRAPYPPEFRQQIIELVRAGRTPEELSREFEPTAQTIHNWVKQADLDEGRRTDGLTTQEREELRRLRRENKQLRIEREILEKAAARPMLRIGARLGRPIPCHRSLRIRESQPGRVRREDVVPCAGRLRQRVLRLEGSTSIGPGQEQCPAGETDAGDSRVQPGDLRTPPHVRRAPR